MRKEYNVFAPLVACIYMVVAFIILVVVLTAFGDTLLTGKSGNVVVDYLIMILYYLCTGDY